MRIERRGSVEGIETDVKQRQVIHDRVHETKSNMGIGYRACRLTRQQHQPTNKPTNERKTCLSIMRHPHTYSPSFLPSLSPFIT
jgi:hypothetical protein